MATPPFLTPPHHRSPSVDADNPVPEPVWGAPSDEMLESERKGDIVLVEDMTRRFPPRSPG